MGPLAPSSQIAEPIHAARLVGINCVMRTLSVNDERYS